MSDMELFLFQKIVSVPSIVEIKKNRNIGYCCLIKERKIKCYRLKVREMKSDQGNLCRTYKSHMIVIN